VDASVVADLDVTAPWSWAGEPSTAPFELGPVSPLRALLGETVGTNVLAIADDVGQYAFVRSPADYSAIAMAGGPFVDYGESPLLEDQAYPGLWALEGRVRKVVLTTTSGATIEPELIDVSRFVDATLVFVPEGTEGVVDVRIERG
jgi:hypothetical protein